MPVAKNLAVVALLSVAVACTATYYKVTDPLTGREYYTVDYMAHKDGAIQFKDARTGATTTVQKPQVLEIDERTFESGVAAPSSR